jgi:tetratricopeptide (TPR) repeat protein
MVELTPKEKVQLLKKPTENLEAYNLYLRGRFFWNKRTKIGFNRAIEYFEQAIEKDSSYPLAYAGLADCYNLLGWYNYLSPKEALPIGKEAAEQAILIDDSLAEAHTSLAWIKLTYDWDWQGAEKEFKRAIQLSPNYATAHQWYVWLLASTKRLDEALLEARRAQELDPISLIINVDVGKALYWMRLFDQAIEQFKKTLLMEPDFPRTHRDLGQAYVHKGMYEEAIEELQKAADLTNRNPYYLQWLGYAYGLAGKQDEAMAVLMELTKKIEQEYIQPLAFAVVNIGLGNKNHALEWLQKAYEERSPELILLNVAPHFDSLRSDPKFKALLKKMGLE